MSNLFTLDALREETLRRYAPVKVQLSDGSVVELKSILRLREQDRKEVLESIESLSSYEDDPEVGEDEAIADYADMVIEVCTKIFKLIAKPSAKKLLAELDDDDLTIKSNLYTAVLSRWVSESQLGEVESSPA